MLDNLPWFCDPCIFHLMSKTLSLIWFDQIYQFVVSSLSHFDFDHEGAILIKLQSLIQFYQSHPWLFQVKIYLYYLSWCVPELTTHLSCFVILNRPHTSISFFDYMCSDINHTLVKEGQIHAPKNDHLDYGPPLFNLSIF